MKITELELRQKAKERMVEASHPKKEQIVAFQKSEKQKLQGNQQQESEKKPSSADEGKPSSGATNNSVVLQKSEKQDVKKPDTITQKPENLPLKKEEKPINITKQVAEKTKTSVDTVSKVKYISEKADAETEKRLMKGDKDLSINKSRARVVRS